MRSVSSDRLHYGLLTGVVSGNLAERSSPVIVACGLLQSQVAHERRGDMLAQTLSQPPFQRSGDAVEGAGDRRIVEEMVRERSRILAGLSVGECIA